MARDSRDAQIPNIRSLQQDEKLSTLLEQDKGADCMPCRIIGWCYFFFLGSIHRRAPNFTLPRCLRVHRPRDLLIFLWAPPAASPGGGDSEKWFNVRNARTPDWYLGDCGCAYRDGSVAVGKLRGYILGRSGWQWVWYWWGDVGSLKTPCSDRVVVSCALNSA